MKIKSSLTQASTSAKKTKSTNKANHFDALLSSQLEPETPLTTQQTPAETVDTLTPKEAPIEDMLQTLEACMHNLENNKESQQQAEQALQQLRHALTQMPDTHLLSQHDRQEAETLLIVEAKRLALLRKFES